MSERVIQGSEIIDLTSVQPKPPSNIIIFSRNNLGQIINTAYSFVKVEGGKEMPIRLIANATPEIGDVAIDVENIPMPEELLQGRYQGVISNEKGAIVWQGKNRMLITSLDAPIHPITGERLNPPGETEVAALPAQSTEKLASHISSGNTVSPYDPNLENSPFLQAPADFNKAA